MTTEKLRVMDQLIDSAETIMVTGEVMLPFLSQGIDIIDSIDGTSAFKRVKFPKYIKACQQFREACCLITRRARLRGVKIIVPCDVQVGDEPIEDSSITQFYFKESAL